MTEIDREMLVMPLTEAELDLCALAEAKVCLQRAYLDRLDAALMRCEEFA